MEAKLKENGLEAAFKETRGPGQAKERARKKNRKKAFLEDLITIKILTVEGDEIPGCTFKLIRKRLTLEVIQDFVDRSPKPCVVDYFYDNTGEVVWMEDMLLTSKPAPAFYVVVAMVLRQPFDICTDMHYDGQTAFVLQYVPKYARDESTPVEEDTLREWLIFAILELDPFVPPIKEAIEKQRGKIKDVDHKLKVVAKQEFLEPDGKAMLPEKADLER